MGNEPPKHCFPEGLSNIDQYVLAIVRVAAVVNQERRVAPANRDLEAVS